MNKSESITNIVAATLKVMEEVKNIDKSMTIGTGTSAYKGVADKDVKRIIGEAMVKNGLAIFPIGIDESIQLSEWDETNQYGVKRKQSVFTRVKTTYLLTHTSGEHIELQGVGHGIDSQDKGAGKATTYALKYALLYTFMIPTGSIDDTDKTHSDDIKTPEPATVTPPVTPPAAKAEPKAKAKLVHASPEYKKCVTAMKGVRGIVYTIADMKEKYIIDAVTEELLLTDSKIII